MHGTHSKHTYTNTLLLTYLQFRFMELPVFSLATLVEAAPLKGVGVPSVSQSGDESSFRRRGSGKLGPGYQSRSSWLYFFGAPGLCPRGGGRSSPIPLMLSRARQGAPQLGLNLWVSFPLTGPPSLWRWVGGGALRAWGEGCCPWGAAVSMEAQRAGVGGGPLGNRVHLTTSSFLPMGSLPPFFSLGGSGLEF